MVDKNSATKEKKWRVKGEGVKQKGEWQSECVKNMCVYDGGKSERKVSSNTAAVDLIPS